MPDEKQQKRVHLVVAGRVQGVGFRYYAHDEAIRIGVTGWVRNLRDGNVVLEAEGTELQLREPIRSVSRGPAFARVTEVQEEWMAPLGIYREFRITH